LSVTLNESEADISRGLSKNVWREVVKAIEDAIPLYDNINDLISFRRAQGARKYAVRNLTPADGSRLLDSGIGPGATSKLILSGLNPGLLVGLDGSVMQLRTAKQNLPHSANIWLEFVRGSFEFLPFRDETFDGIVTSFAFRDSLDMEQSVTEYSRVCASKGSFAIADIAKPDNRLKRAGAALYLRFIMPFVANIAIRGRIRGNPWRMIVPTYVSLPTTKVIVSMVKAKFANVELKEFLLGGAIVIIGRKS
jgi:demethylmenaquinone methyltransferase/2-methoxy-6-polyprenyl-1,4-benzoquinol methylase